MRTFTFKRPWQGTKKNYCCLCVLHKLDGLSHFLHSAQELSGKVWPFDKKYPASHKKVLSLLGIQQKRQKEALLRDRGELCGNAKTSVFF